MKLVYCSANIYLLVYISHFLPIISRRHLKHTADKCTCAWEFKKPFIFCFITLRYIQAKINEQFFSSSLEYPQKVLRSTVHWLFPVRPSGMNGRGDFKSAGVGTGKFVGCVCRRCYIHFISEPPERRIGKGLFFYLFMDCLFLTNSKMSFYVIFLLFSSSIFKI